jgi:hypothetical protein
MRAYAPQGWNGTLGLLRRSDSRNGRASDGLRHHSRGCTAEPRIRMNARAAIRSAKKNRAAKNSRAVSS